MSSLHQILSAFISDANDFDIRPFGTGLIHRTYVVAKNNQPVYILQALNHHVFKNPDAIAANISEMGNYLRQNHPNEVFPGFISTLNGEFYHYDNHQPYRLSSFIKGSHTIDTCTNPEQAYEAAFQFGKFTSLFSNLNMNHLQETISQFHDLAFRWKQFEDCLEKGNHERIIISKNEINFIRQNKFIVDKYSTLISDNSLQLRVTHHDTKISNVLFDDQNKGICVIDLDTTMPGYFMSDVGDMFRTYLSEANEEEQDIEKVIARKSYYNAIIDGYSTAMSGLLLDKEKEFLQFSGECMIYMQSLRFLTDFINNDIYYGAKYELHNFNRAKNQLKLLKEFQHISS